MGKIHWQFDIFKALFNSFPNYMASDCFINSSLLIISYNININKIFFLNSTLKSTTIGDYGNKPLLCTKIMPKVWCILCHIKLRDS